MQKENFEQPKVNGGAEVFVGESCSARLITAFAYYAILTGHIVLPVVFFVLLFYSYEEIPKVLIFLMFLFVGWAAYVVYFTIKCWLRKDCFCFDYPLTAQISNGECLFKSVVSKGTITPGMVLKIKHFPFSSASNNWTKIVVNIGGKRKSLLLSPWFRNKDKVISVLSKLPKEDVRNTSGQ